MTLNTAMKIETFTTVTPVFVKPAKICILHPAAFLSPKMLEIMAVIDEALVSAPSADEMQVLRRRAGMKLVQEESTSVDFDDAVFTEMSEIDEIAITSFIAFSQKFSEATIKRSRSKHPTGRGEQKQSKQWFNTPWGMNEKAECEGFNKPFVNSKAPSIEDGLADYYKEMAEATADEQDNSWTDADYFNYCHDKGMLCDEADDTVGDIAVLDEDSIIDKLISSLSVDAGEDTLEQRLAASDAQMLSEYFDEDKEWADYQAKLAKATVETDSSNEPGSFDEDDYQEDPDAGHYVSTSSPEFLESGCADEDGDAHLYNDDPEFYIRQECGTVFEGEECHVPPSIESRFDILGGAGARNMYASNSKWTGLTGFRYLMNY